MTRDWADYPHVRIYSSINVDPKFDDVRDDDRAFAWYVRLLLVAHDAHPSSAYLPRVPRKVLATLQCAGLIAVSGNRFTMSGVAKERSEVADQAHRAGGTIRAATADRDESGRFTAGPAASSEAGPAGFARFAREVEVSNTDDGRTDIEAFVLVKRRAPTLGQRKVLDDVLRSHDVSGPQWAADIILAHPHDPIGAVIEAQKAWRAERKAGAIAEEQASEARKHRGLRDPLLQEIARTMAERDEQPGAAA